MISIETHSEVDGSLIAQELNAPHVRVEGENPCTITVFGTEATEEELLTAAENAVIEV